MAYLCISELKAFVHKIVITSDEVYNSRSVCAYYKWVGMSSNKQNYMSNTVISNKQNYIVL